MRLARVLIGMTAIGPHFIFTVVAMLEDTLIVAMSVVTILSELVKLSPQTDTLF